MEWVENRPTRGLRGLSIRELWTARELAWVLARRDLTVRYKQAAFGVAWAIVQPLASMAVFTVVFDRLAEIPSEGVPYPLFAFVGAIAWAYLSGSVSAATDSLVANTELVTKVYFPRVAAPLAAVLPGLVDLAVSTVALGVLLAVFGVVPPFARLGAAPLAVLLLAAIALGVGLWFAALNVRYRDVRHAVGLLLQVWLFASPIAYPASLVPARWQGAYALNPVVGAVELLRWATLGTRFPGREVAISVVVTAALLAGGLVFFRTHERRFADVI